MGKRSAIRIAAAGDVHCSDENRAAVVPAFAAIAAEADAILLAGDLTTLGEPAQAQVLADACGELAVPVVAVLGNHDWHCDRADEIVDVLTAAGIVVLDRGWTILELAGTRVGVVGTKGFVGGFPDATLTDFGEPIMRAVYAETTAEVEALERGLEAVSDCRVRIVLLHYSPTSSTIEGEPHGIWAFLGSDRLARPIAEHRPDLVLHGHGHAGTFEGFVGAVPVYNVSIPVMGRDFTIFELEETPSGDVSPVVPAGEIERRKEVH
ncbi:MAG TPA: metallophosphoesterase [Gaiellaceae bacterium]|nr:metallophosphoesterase [Gaiellaceae bacterium]